MKHIQTQIDTELYVQLLEIARAADTSLKEQVRRALKEFVDKRRGRVPKDPLFSLVGSLETSEGGWSTRKDWRA